MAEDNLGACNIFDLRVMALIGCRSVAKLGPEALHITEALLRPAKHGKAELRLIDPAARAVAEG